MGLEDLILNVADVEIHFESRVHQGPELWRAVSRKVEEFRDFGLRPRDPVVLHLELSDEYIVSLLAMLSLDLVVVPADPSTPLPFLKELAKVSAVVAMVNSTGLERVERVDRRSENPALTQAQYILFTSGSTGKPRGVLGSREGLINRIAWGRDQFFSGPITNCCVRASPAFVDSLTEILGAVAAGKRLLVVPPSARHDFGSFVRFVSESRAELVTCTPSAVPVISQLSEQWPLGDVRRWVFSGEELRRDWVSKVRTLSPNAEIINSYGSTEVSGDVTFFRLPPDAQIPARIPIGTGVPGVELRVVADDGTVGAGRGELHVGGSQVALGYLGDAPEKAPVFWTETGLDAIDVRWFRTHDLVEVLDAGLVYVGRRGNTDKVRGRRVDVNGVARQLEALPGVTEAAAWVEEDQVGLRTLAAAVALTSDDLSTPSLLLTILSESVLPQMVPDRLVMVDRLPRTTSGKVDRRALMRDGSPRKLPREQDFATGIEYAIALAIAEVIGTGKFGSRTRLREIGLDSLRSVLAAERICQMLGCSIDALELLAKDSVEEIAHAAISLQGKPRAGALRVVRAGVGTPLIFVHPAIGTGIGYFPLVSRLPASLPIVFLELDPEATGQLVSGGIGKLAQHYAGLIAKHLDTDLVHLVGHSFGAVLLPALCRELEGRGIAVPIPVLLDPTIPTTAPPSALDWALRRILSDSGYDADLPPEVIDLSGALNLVRTRPGPLRGVSEDLIAHWARVLTASSGSLYGYAPPAWERKALVVMARKRDSVVGDTTWVQAALSDATVKTIECSHFELTRPPFINDVADLIVSLVTGANHGGAPRANGRHNST